jgi:exopolysaccharide biosynthesis predicted pyruvyltransferase EpsI
MTIHEYLQQYKGQTIYYKPNPGNGGDALIALGAYQLFKKLDIEYKIITEDHDLNNKIVFYGGGGNFISHYNDVANFINKYHKAVRKLVLLPHTVEGHAELLVTLGKNVDIICREQQSYDFLSQFTNIGSVQLMDDLAFSLDIPVIMNSVYPKSLLFKYLLKIYGKKIFRKKTFDFFVLNAYRTDVERTSINIPADNIDVSNVYRFDFSMKNEDLVLQNVTIIFNFLDKFKVINTNRLHIGIAGALLGKEVNFYPNAYWKNQAVYEQSIKGKFPNLNWKGENARSLSHSVLL